MAYKTKDTPTAFPNYNLQRLLTGSNPLALALAKEEPAPEGFNFSGYSPVTVSPEAAAELTPEQVQDIRSSQPDKTISLLKTLAMIASLFSPGLLPVAAGARAIEGDIRGRRESEEQQAYARNVARSEQALRGRTAGVQERQAATAEKQTLLDMLREGLEPTPAGAVPGYMSLGESRRKTLEVAEDKNAAQREKIMTKLEGTLVPLAEKLTKGGKLSEDEWRSFEYITKVLQSLRSFPAVMPWAQQGAPELPSRPGGGAAIERPSAPKAEKPGAATRTGKTASNGKVRIFEYSDGTWRDAQGKEYK